MSHAAGSLLLRFDLLVPRDCPAKPAELREMFQRELEKYGERVKVSIRIEHAFVPRVCRGARGRRAKNEGNYSASIPFDR